MTQALTTKIRGLYTFPNDFSAVPEGALSVADNIIVDRDSVMEPRRGVTYLADADGRADFIDSAERAEKIFFYDDTIIAHTKIGAYHHLNYFSSSDGWHDISGPVVAKTVHTGAAGGSDYFSTNLYSIVKPGHGFYTGLKIYLTIDGGSLPTGLTTGYYYVYVITASSFTVCSTYDNAINGVYITFSDRGSNGQIATFTPYPVVESPTTTIKSRAVLSKQNLYFTTRDGVFCIDDRTSYPRRVGVPEALALYNVTGGELSNNTPKWFEINEKVAYRIVIGYKDLNGNLYLSAPSGRGYIINSTGTYSVNVNIQLPVYGLTTSHFIQLYRSETVASTAEPSDELKLAYEAYLTSAQIAAGLIIVNDITPQEFLGASLYTNDSQQGLTYANVIPPKCMDIALFKDFMFYANTTDQQTYILTLKNVVGITTGDILKIGATTFYANEDPGSGRPGWTVSTGGTDAENIQRTALNLVYSINRWQSQYYATYASGVNDIPGKIILRSYSVNAPAFVLNSSTGAGAATTYWMPPLPVSGNVEISTAEVTPNGLSCSKVLEPEHVPLPYRNFAAGSKDSGILRIMPLRDSLFIFKDSPEGIWRLWGTDPTNFQIAEFDNTANLIAPDTVCVLNNQIFALTTQGVIAVTESGVTIMSRPIEGDLLGLLTENPTVVAQQAFAYAHETQRAYYLFLPSSATDTGPTQYYRYNTITNNWTRGTLAKSCGGVNPVDDLMYLGDSLQRFLNVENKTNESTDYADYVTTETISAVSGTTVTISNASSLEVGNVIFQAPNYSVQTGLVGAGGIFNATTHVITINSHGYYTGLKITLSINSGSLPTGLPAGDYWVVKTGANTFQLATSYANAINSSPVIVEFSDVGTDGKTATFTPSTSDIWAEIESIGTTTVTTKYPARFLITSADVVAPIATAWKFVPQTFGNPGINKQIREVALLFLSDFYGEANVNFVTDISPTELSETITGSIAAPWGRFPWGSAPWGGVLRRRPVRVMVPRIHQRASLIIVGFEHDVCFSPWKIQGISYVGNNLSEKVWHQGDTI